MDGGWGMDGGRVTEVEKNMIFRNFSKSTQYCFGVVSRTLRIAEIQFQASTSIASLTNPNMINANGLLVCALS